MQIAYKLMFSIWLSIERIMRKFWIFWDQWSFGIFEKFFIQFHWPGETFTEVATPIPIYNCLEFLAGGKALKMHFSTKMFLKLSKIWYVMTAFIEDQKRFVGLLLCSFLYNHLFHFMFIFRIIFAEHWNYYFVSIFSHHRYKLVAWY